MGFFDKIKKGLGIGTAKVELILDPSYTKEGGQVTGKIRITAKGDQRVLSQEFDIKQRITSGRGDDKSSKEKTIGEVKFKEPFDIKEGEVKEIEFVLPFAPITTTNESLKSQGGALGALGKLGSAMSNEHVEYWVSAMVDLEGVALDPNDTERVNLV